MNAGVIILIIVVIIIVLAVTGFLIWYFGFRKKTPTPPGDSGGVSGTSGTNGPPQLGILPPPGTIGAPISTVPPGSTPPSSNNPVAIYSESLAKYLRVRNLFVFRYEQEVSLEDITSTSKCIEFSFIYDPNSENLISGITGLSGNGRGSGTPFTPILAANPTNGSEVVVQSLTDSTLSNKWTYNNLDKTWCLTDTINDAQPLCIKATGGKIRVQALPSPVTSDFQFHYLPPPTQICQPGPSTG